MTRARPLAALLALAALAGCAYRSDEQPSNVENACAILDERPHWARALEEAEDRWGAPKHVAMAIIWKESSFRPDVRPSRTTYLGFIPGPPRSSAYGFSQAIDGTWEWYKESTGNWGADRDDFEDSADFVGWYMTQTRRQNGIPMSDAYNQYLSYHEGHAGWRRGNWKGKGWLRQVASQVHRKAAEYQNQLKYCA